MHTYYACETEPIKEAWGGPPLGSKEKSFLGLLHRRTPWQQKRHVQSCRSARSLDASPPKPLLPRARQCTSRKGVQLCADGAAPSHRELRRNMAWTDSRAAMSFTQKSAGTYLQKTCVLAFSLQHTSCIMGYLSIIRRARDFAVKRPTCFISL